MAKNKENQTNVADNAQNGSKLRNKRRSAEEIINFKQKQIQERGSKVVVPNNGISLMLTHLVGAVDRILFKTPSEELVRIETEEERVAKNNVRKKVIELADEIGKLAHVLGKKYLEKDYIKIQKDELAKEELAK
ncbi:Uncharacterised protein [Campylobacter hyointestinalis subsp. hyointestinalis]|uniref:Uncharacterized protein n=1 Tax=Campylobacter hyointestinalis subsp. hyointestinalis TaxID=91352 RepID=A0A0S4SW23_CAMHY|nr:hypothetical protein [Campylobacter hyointestinalis]CUU89977.1 Uncharacterised protein [Campylobacter hyointestinalis subsp. hyointestinalis]